MKMIAPDTSSKPALLYAVCDTINEPSDKDQPSDKVRYCEEDVRHGSVKNVRAYQNPYASLQVSQSCSLVIVICARNLAIYYNEITKLKE